MCFFIAETMGVGLQMSGTGLQAANKNKMN